MVTLGGVQIGAIYVPWGDNGTFVLGRDLAIPVTILFTVLTINAMNFIDGLDGLAAGVTVIAAIAFFVYSYHLGRTGFTDIVSPRRPCSRPRWPAPASASCRTTSSRPASSWATRARWCSG